jgi:hypothetical protein
VVNVFSVHGIDAQHHTHQCPSAVKMKLEWEAEEKAKAAGMAVNHVMKYQNAGQFRALPPPYRNQPYQPSAPAHVFHPPQQYTPSAPQLLPPPPSHAQAIFGFHAFVAEPGRPPPSTLHPHPTPTSTPTKAGGP